jgi:hypothetical protein
MGYIRRPLTHNYKVKHSPWIQANEEEGGKRNREARTQMKRKPKDYY